MNSSVPRRCSIRLRDFDYASEGLYFVTICTDRRVAIFGEIVAQEMVLNDFGIIVEEIWHTMFHLESNSKNWIVMPNHLHGIIAMMDDIVGLRITPGAKPLGRLVGVFKTASTNRANEMRATPGAAVWQRNFYEHIIRDERSFGNIAHYLEDNPARWGTDPENPFAIESPWNRRGNTRGDDARGKIPTNATSLRVVSRTTPTQMQNDPATS